jgi:hypothetical protein
MKSNFKFLSRLSANRQKATRQLNCGPEICQARAPSMAQRIYWSGLFLVLGGIVTSSACVQAPSGPENPTDPTDLSEEPPPNPNPSHDGGATDLTDAGSIPENMDAGFGTDAGLTSGPDASDPEWILETCEPTAAPSPIRRLSRTEYNLVMRDLIGTDLQPADSFVPDEEMHGFDNNASALWVSQILAEQYQLAAEMVAASVTEDIDGLLHCQAMFWSEEQCALAFVESFGQKAYRRPLTEDEYDRLAVLFEEQKLLDDSIASGVAAVIEALLQSPHFLYRVEFGDEGAAVGGIAKLTAYEIATRMSFLLWNSMPDQELFDAVEGGQLSTPEEIEQQARRMVEDPKAKDALHNFHSQWLHLDKLAYASKDETMFPGFSSNIKPLLQEETYRFLEFIFEDETASLHDLLLSNTTFLNQELATHYEMDGVPSEDWAPVFMPPEQRAGILTLGGVMAGLSKHNQTSPILRGVFVRETLLCDPPPPPPDDVDITPPEFNPDLSTRERFAAHTEDPACAGCHEMIDPIGFGFENYDPVGRYRETEGDGIVVDASGELLYTIDVDGSFVGAVDLAHRLSDSTQVQDCYVDNWFRFGYGRTVRFEDQCTTDGLREVFESTSGNLEELLVALTQTPAFNYRPLEEATNE